MMARIPHIPVEAVVSPDSEFQVENPSRQRLTFANLRFDASASNIHVPFFRARRFQLPGPRGSRDSGTE